MEIVHREGSELPDWTDRPALATEPYDHLIRDEEGLQNQVEYVFANPVRAGLKNWKWVGGGKV